MPKIIITGASKGIGKALAAKFSEIQDIRMLLISRNHSMLQELKSELSDSNPKASIDILACDINKEIPEIPIKAFAENGSGLIDILINNAGLLIHKPVNELSSKDFDEMFNTNVKAPFTLIQTLIPYMNKPSHIVNIGSMGGYQGSAKFPGLSLYSASKGALAVLSECLAEELKPFGIHVNALALGAVDTEMLQQAFPGYQAPQTPAQMAEFIGDFALNGFRYFNGKVLPVSISTP